MPWAGGGIPILYLLRDLFTTAESAPITSPRTAEPGPGTLTVVQTNGQIAISGGTANLPVGTNTVFGLGWYGTTNQGRVAGRTVYQTFDITTIADAAPLAWSKAASVNFASYNNIGAGLYLSTSPLVVIDNTVSTGDVAPTNLVTGAIYQETIIQRAAGALICIEGGIYTRPTLLWPCVGDSTTTQHPATSNAKAAYNVDEFAVTDLAGAYATTYGLATSATTSPASGATATTDIEFLAEFTWTPASAEVMEIDLRYVSADDRWIVRCDQAGSTIKLMEVEAGVETQRRTAAQTFTAGTPYRIVVTALVGWYTAQVNGIQKVVPFAVPVTQPVDLYTTGIRVTGFATGANLVTWPRTLPAFSFGLNRPLSSFFIVGDSKAPYSGWPTTFQRDSSTASVAWANAYPQCDIGSSTWAIMQGVIDARLALHISDNPTAVLANLGVNDVVTLPTEAALKTSVNYCLDAIHTKWPNATIYLARVWRRSYNAECDTIDTWFDDIITSRSDTLAGPDERITIKADDDGNTMTTDGVHYSAAGIVAITAAWRTSLG